MLSSLQLVACDRLRFHNIFCTCCEKDDVEGIALFFNIHVESAQKLASQKGSIYLRMGRVKINYANTNLPCRKTSKGTFLQLSPSPRIWGNSSKMQVFTKFPEMFDAVPDSHWEVPIFGASCRVGPSLISRAL